VLEVGLVAHMLLKKSIAGGAFAFVLVAVKLDAVCAGNSVLPAVVSASVAVVLGGRGGRILGGVVCRLGGGIGSRVGSGVSGRLSGGIGSRIRSGVSGRLGGRVGSGVRSGIGSGIQSRLGGGVGSGVRSGIGGGIGGGVGGGGIGHASVVLVAAALALAFRVADVLCPVRLVVHVEGLAVSGGLVVNTDLAGLDELVHLLPELALEAVTLALAEEELVVLVGGGVEAVTFLPVGGRVVVQRRFLKPHTASNPAVFVRTTGGAAASVHHAPLVLA
jgi:hypothetical protein